MTSSSKPNFAIPTNSPAIPQSSQGALSFHTSIHAFMPTAWLATATESASAASEPKAPDAVASLDVSLPARQQRTEPNSTIDWRQERILFVTGKLAAPQLQDQVAALSKRLGFHADVFVAKISVAALMTTDWLIGKLPVPPGTTRILLPGLCRGELERLQAAVGQVLVERGPNDIQELPRYFALAGQAFEALPLTPDLEIIAEINHANRLPLPVLRQLALTYRQAGADRIDLGCTPGEPWSEIAAAVAVLIQDGHRLSVDSFDPDEVDQATQAGVDLVLSVNASNRQRASAWGAEVVVIPTQHDQPDWLQDLHESVAVLEAAGVRYRLDPILEPIGFGFAASLERYLRTRQAFPDAALMMGVGNITELTAADTAGMNALLAGFCQELAIGSVLTTQVIPWARECIRELDVARRLMKDAVERRRLPKHRDDRLVQLHDPQLPNPPRATWLQLQQQLRDKNYRIVVEHLSDFMPATYPKTNAGSANLPEHFSISPEPGSQGGQIHVFNSERFISGTDAFEIFEQLAVEDPGHAFYLGWELQKAVTALNLGKHYIQDRSLRWGLATVEEISHQDRQRQRHRVDPD